MSDNQALGAAYHIKQVIIIAIFSGLASVAVMLRVWARRIQNMSLELNDCLILFGLVIPNPPDTPNVHPSDCISFVR